jgi:hypothetical protein
MLHETRFPRQGFYAGVKSVEFIKRKHLFMQPRGSTDVFAGTITTLDLVIAAS